jgi:hypothetical protein
MPSTHLTHRPLLLLACALAFAASAILAGCGGAAHDPGNITIYQNFSTRHNDRDNDGDHNKDDGGIVGFGHAADAVDYASSAALVEHYLADAAAANGPAACRLLAPFIAESVVEQIGNTSQTHGKTCGAVLSKLFALHHTELASKQASMHIEAIRVQGVHALAIIRFSSIPLSQQMTERLVGGRWLLLSVLDGLIE